MLGAFSGTRDVEMNKGNLCLQVALKLVGETDIVGEKTDHYNTV